MVDINRVPTILNTLHSLGINWGWGGGCGSRPSDVVFKAVGHMVTCMKSTHTENSALLWAPTFRQMILFPF